MNVGQKHVLIEFQQFLVDQMKSGIIDPKTLLSKYSKKYTRSLSAFNKDIKEAKKIYNNWLIQENELKDQERKQLSQSAAKKSYLDRDRLVKMAADVLTISYNQIATTHQEKKHVPHSDLKGFASVHARFCQLEGHNMPDKVAMTDPEGKPVNLLETLIMAANGVKIDDK